MSNEMTPFGGGLPSTESLGKGLAGYRPPPASSGKAYLKLTKGGEWVYGAEETDIDGRAAVNPFSICAGYVSWGEGEKLGEAMANVMQGEALIDPSTLEPTGEPWEPQVGFDLVMVDGDDRELELVYHTNSVGGKRAHAALVKAVQAQYAEDPEKCVPVVEFHQDHYQHKKYGRIYTPEFRVVDWLSMDGKPAAKKKAAKKPTAKARTRKRN